MTFDAAWLAEHPPPIVAADRRYIQEYTLPGSGTNLDDPPVPMPIWHLDGLPWAVIDPPAARHGHWAQTVVGLSPVEVVRRCPCGAIRDRIGWYPCPGEVRVAEPAPSVAAPSAPPPWWRRWFGGTR